MEAGHNDGEGGCTQIHRDMCATGTMWGVLKDAPFWKLALWWLVRHAIYGSVIAAIIISELPAIVYQILGVFIMVIHSYKLWRYLSADDSLKEVRSIHMFLKTGSYRRAKLLQITVCRCFTSQHCVTSLRASDI